MQMLEDDKTKLREGLEVLQEVQKTFPSAILAGGYLRDSILGGKPKDIDIFIPFTETEEVDSVMKSYSATELVGARYMPQQEVSRVWDIDPVTSFIDSLSNVNSKIHSSLPVQIIMLQKDMTVKSRINDYDFALCQIYTDGNDIFCTEAFIEDVKNKTCTLVVCEDEVQYRRSMRRFDRFKKKYPELVLRIDTKIKYFENFEIVEVKE